MWPFSELRPDVPPEMTLEEARASGLVPPAEWTPPPRATKRDTARTAFALGRSLPYAVGGAIAGATFGVDDIDRAHARVRAWARRTLRRLGIILEVVHGDRLPASGGVVVMWNQESHLDHLVLPAAIPRPLLSVYNNSVARTPFYGRYLRNTGHVHVDRHDEAQWRPALAAAAVRIREGGCLLISPEGTRSWDGELLAMKRGAFIVARAAGVPIVCATVIGGHIRLPRGAAAVRPGPMRVVFSDAIPVPVDGGPPGQLEAQVAGTSAARLKREYALPGQ